MSLVLFVVGGVHYSSKIALWKIVRVDDWVAERWSLPVMKLTIGGFRWRPRGSIYYMIRYSCPLIFRSKFYGIFNRKQCYLDRVSLTWDNMNLLHSTVIVLHKKYRLTDKQTDLWASWTCRVRWRLRRLDGRPCGPRPATRTRWCLSPTCRCSLPSRSGSPAEPSTLENIQETFCTFVNIVTACKRSLGQGKILTGVCQSFC